MSENSTQLVLIVDDEPALRDALAYLIKSIGAQALTAASGEEALDRIIENKVDLVIMDATLPGMSGYETASRIWGTEASQAMQVMFLSGDAGGETLARNAAEAAGADFEYVVKTVPPNILMEKIAARLKKAQ